MAEDQTVNGDKWTNEGGELLKKLGWEQVGDSNIDIEDSKGKNTGIDSIFKFQDGFRLGKYQTVFFEAKRYAEKSFKWQELEKWIITLDSKIKRLRNAPDLYLKFPELEDGCIFGSGLIAIWFHDIKNFEEYKAKFLEALNKIKISYTTTKLTPSKIYVITNDKILELSSLYQSIKEMVGNEDIEHKDDVKFFYPSSLDLGSGVQETNVLNFNYMYSKFIFAKASSAKSRNKNIVFYFDEIDAASFDSLIGAMIQYNFLEVKNDLIIYKYKRDDEFRKIKPSIIQKLKRKGLNKENQIEIRDMFKFNELPPWLSNNK